MLPRVAIFGPCLGVGGGDQFFSSLVRFARTIKFVGIFVEFGATPEQYARAKWQTGGGVPFHQGVKPNGGRHDAATYHDDNRIAMLSALQGAEILINWHCPSLFDIAKEIKIPVIEVSQNEDDYAKLCYQRVKEIAGYRVAVSKAAGDACFPGESYRTIPNGIEVERCLPAIGRETQRHLWGMAGEERVILFAGRIAEEKRPELLLHAMHYLPENFSILFVGDGPLLENLSKQSSELFPGRVRYLDPQERLGDCFAAADVFVLPSKVEGDSLAIKEALVSGIPVVASLVGSAPDYAAELVGVAKDCSPRDLAAAIVRATDSGRNSARRGDLADQFSISRIAREWEGFLCSLAIAGRQETNSAQQKSLMDSLCATPVRLFTKG